MKISFKYKTPKQKISNLNRNKKLLKEAIDFQCCSQFGTFLTWLKLTTALEKLNGKKDIKLEV